MTEVRDPAIAALLAEARRGFAASLPAKVADLASCLGRGAWEDLRRGSHKLRGSTGTYGFLELSAIFGEIEDQLLEAGTPGPDLVTRITQRVAEAATEAERAVKGSR